MALYSFDNRSPKVGKGAYVHPTADVIGDVTLGEGTFVGAGAVIRGDYGRIIIGTNCSVEENCTLHARPGEVSTIGDWVTVGHAAIIHNAKMIHDYAVIGMGAVVSDYAEVGEWAIVAEGAVVKNGQVIPPNTVNVGAPAKAVKEVTEEMKAQWRIFKRNYVDLARTYPERMKRLD
jgi:carbonic anhydrase/acetyltransferase-like protein (isoleucine patch superfamily)